MTANVAAHPRLHRFQAAVGCSRVFGGPVLPGSQESFDDDDVHIEAAQLRVPLCFADDSEAVFLVRSEGHRIVGPDIRKDLFVTLPPRRFEGGRKKAFGDSLSPASEVDISADNSDV